jgi:hypothetical protein
MAQCTGPIDGSVVERRESMENILGSWALEDALPDEAGMKVVRAYVAGDLTLQEAIEAMRRAPLPNGTVVGP